MLKKFLQRKKVLKKTKKRFFALGGTPVRDIIKIVLLRNKERVKKHTAEVLKKRWEEYEANALIEGTEENAQKRWLEDSESSSSAENETEMPTFDDETEILWPRDPAHLKVLVDRFEREKHAFTKKMTEEGEFPAGRV